MKWVSVDPSNKTGLAFWDNDRLLSTFTARAMGAKGKWLVERTRGIVEKLPFDSKIECFRFAFFSQSKVIMEEGFGQFKTAIKSQAEYRGYIKAAIDSLNVIDEKSIGLCVVNVMEWRRAIKDEFSITWPATTERKKQLAVKLVKQAHGLDVTDDEADAVLLGHAALRMGFIAKEG